MRQKIINAREATPTMALRIGTIVFPEEELEVLAGDEVVDAVTLFTLVLSGWLTGRD